MSAAVDTDPVLSVVVPVFNGIPHIARCTNSIREALAHLPPIDRQRIEVVLSDNWSTDGTRQVLESSRIECNSRIVSPGTHLGRAAHWAFGLNEARGKWLMMLHADDQLSGPALLIIVAAARRADRWNAVVISGRHHELAPDGGSVRQRPKWPFPGILSGDRLRKYILPFLCPFVPFSPFLRSAYLAVGGLSTRFELVQDWELWIRLLARGDVLYIPQVLGSWQTHSFSQTYAQTFAAEYMEMAARLPALVPDLSKSGRRRSQLTQRSRAAILLSPLDDRVRPETTLRRLIRQATLRLTFERAIGTVRLLAR